MSRGKSGRVVIEMDPALKQRLYVELAKDDLTLKDWFISSAHSYLESRESVACTVKKTTAGKRKK